MTFYTHAIKVISQYAEKDRHSHLRLIKVTPRDGYVLITATDRYTCGEYRIDDDTAEADMSFLIDPAIAKALGMQHKNALTLEHLMAAADDREASSIPDIARFLTVVPSGGFPEIRFNGDFLAKFKGSVLARESRDKNDPVVLHFGDTARQPVVVSFGDYFRGAIVPMRIL